MALKASHPDSPDAEKTAEAHRALKRLAMALAGQNDRTAALKVIHSTGKPVYGAAPGREDRVQQVWPDGLRVVGRIVDQEFIADEPLTAPSA